MRIFISNFLDHIQKEKRFSPHTVLAYSNDLAQFQFHMEQQLDIRAIASIDHHDIRTWIVSILEDEELQATTVNRKISCLRSFFKYLEKNDIISSNPMARITSLKTKKKLPMFIEQAQMDRLLDEMDFGPGLAGVRDKLIIDLLYNTGMRRAELIGLRMADLHVGQQEIKVLGKRNKERIIPLSLKMMRSIRAYTELRDHEIGKTLPSDHLLISDRGEQMTDGFVYRKVNKYLRLITTIEKTSPHILRHTFATQMLNNGADLNAIKEILGHADLAATQIYTHNTIEKLTKVYKQAHPRA